MNQNDLEKTYGERIQQYEKELSIIKSKLWWASFFRLIVFAATGYGVYRLFTATGNVTTIATIVMLGLFLWLVKYSGQLSNKKELAANLLLINENELGVQKGQTNRFASGPSNAPGESYQQDLDVFGNGSLYECINRTQTSIGEAALGGLLSKTFTDPTKIAEQQQAIKVLAPQVDSRQIIMAEAMIIQSKETNPQHLFEWVKQPVVLQQKKWLLAAAFILPVANFIALFYYLQTDRYLLLSITVLLSWLCVCAVAKYSNEQSAAIGKKEEVLLGFANILHRFGTVQATEPGLLQTLINQTTSAEKEITQLSRLSNLLDQRLNVLVNILLNSFLLYDVHCLFALERWKSRNNNQLHHWLSSVGLIECLNSLATYAFNHPKNVYPIFSEKPGIEAKDIYHPLISPDENIPNDFSLGSPHKIMLITGSNMSGKTTFLRTVGTNVLLAQCGLPVCATSFQFSPMQLFSSIRVSDSLQQHTSYFMAELKRLQFIVDRISGNQPALVLIDEILRGTNSDDKYNGSHQFVQRLVTFNCLTLFATHDLALSTLANEYKNDVTNYCFESTIEENQLLFDYKIQPGVAKNKNASFLMQRMGIIS